MSFEEEDTYMNHRNGIQGFGNKKRRYRQRGCLRQHLLPASIYEQEDTYEEEDTCGIVSAAACQRFSKSQTKKTKQKRHCKAL